MKKKICYVTTIPGTLKAFVFPVAKRIIQLEDWDVTFICDDDASFLAELPSGIRYVSVKMKRGISLSGFATVLKLYKIFRREGFDLVQYSTPNASCYASIAAYLARVPVRLYCQWGIAYVGFSGLKRAVFKVIERIVCSLSTWIEPDSRGNLIFSHEEGLYPEKKGSVVWNGSASGVDFQKFNRLNKEEWRQQVRREKGVADDAFVFAFVGRITGDKGVNELLASYQKLLSEGVRNTRLMLVGAIEKDQSLDGALLEWARSCAEVIFCGRVNDVERYMAAADVYVLPSYREGFGSSVIEAEAMAVPVIVTDIPGPTDAMKPEVTGLTVKKGDVHSLLLAMRRLENERDLSVRLGEAGFEFAKRGFEQSVFINHVIEDRRKLLEAVRP